MARGLAATSALAAVASLAGVAFSAVADSFRMGFGTLTLMAEFVPTATTDVINGAILAPILLYAYAALAERKAKRPERPTGSP